MLPERLQRTSQQQERPPPASLQTTDLYAQHTPPLFSLSLWFVFLSRSAARSGLQRLEMGAVQREREAEATGSQGLTFLKEMTAVCIDSHTHTHRET